MAHTTQLNLSSFGLTVKSSFQPFSCNPILGQVEHTTKQTAGEILDSVNK